MGSRLDAIGDWEALARQAGFRVKDLARLSSVDRRQLHRFFVDHTGSGPGRWLSDARLKFALELLQSGKPICQIAAEVGFNHESSFYHFFHRATGETPQAYSKH